MDWFSDDITFCGDECSNRKCFRHPDNRRNKLRPYSMSLFKGTQYCPMSRSSNGKENEPQENTLHPG